MKGFERAIQLKGVTISANKDNSLYKSHSFNSNACGDYVCRYHVLNCPNHRDERDNRTPVQGEFYYENGSLIHYRGCFESEKKFNYTIPGIYIAKEFYGSDYSEVSLSAPEYTSTIYWKHLVRINSTKETTLDFYTSDITGKFRIVVQGVTSNDVVYGESFFNVQKPR